ncbi:flagellar protein FlaG [Conexibacter arvalis]|uniref:Flagellar protein FlaG n=1 Tax=Conexibacter arvalis TaxID=912552 RepID=A0A840I826_9ACTN|nr:flagellar protein FlaG [Conexibacter arvalis]MBB4661017.1 flagellar protein FlaG [Conexibacter arvalis]
MNLDVAPVGPTSYSPAHRTPSPAPRPLQPVPVVRADISGDTIPDSPPREVLDAMDAASRAYQQLRAQGRELRFSQDADSGRLTIEVRDLDGNLLRRIPPSKLLDVATTGGLD